MNLNLLKQAGLTEGEIKVYLALLELGLSTSGNIIKKSNIAKSIVYQILEKLEKKGLVSHIIKSKTMYFQASSPEKILNYIEEKEKDLKQTKEEIEKILPELLLKEKFGDKSEATVYTGYKGIITAYEKVYKKLKKGEEYYYLGIPTYQPKEMHLFWQRDHIRRQKEGIKCKLLFNIDTNQEILKNRNSFKGCEARYILSDIKTPAGFLIYKDTTVIILQSPTMIAVEIVNQDITNSFQSYFDEFWSRSNSELDDYLEGKKNAKKLF